MGDSVVSSSGVMVVAVAVVAAVVVVVAVVAVVVVAVVVVVVNHVYHCEGVSTIPCCSRAAQIELHE